ncbi:MAG: hypothetical protein L7U70_03380 [Flavobacteriales bacterium]|nr:hypothetical protein [Flavobacteriales bacterium]
MKKLALFLFGVFATTFTVNAQITSASFTTPVNTGANMTVGMNATKFDQFEGGTIGAFYDLNGDGTLQCVGSEAILTGFFGLAIWGDDSSTPETDGLASGAVPQFAILHEGDVILIDEIPQFTGYVTNGMANITDANLTSAVAGCTDASACNAMAMYSDVTYSDDGSCTYASTGYDCDGVCLVDTDNDGVCDEFEVAGCQDASACNYDALATDSDGSCDFPQMYYDCAGQCISDVDADGVCDELEVEGCQDEAYDNYDASATDAGTCTGLLGCTDSLYFEYYAVSPPTWSDIVADNSAGYEVDDMSCVTEIVVGCTNPAASNFNPDANVNITDESHPDACVIEGINFTPLSDSDNSSIVLTGNNMSLLFQPEDDTKFDAASSTIEAGDILAAVYETDRLENEFLGYSAISGLANAGSVVWTGGQVGLAVFGADNQLNNNGFDTYEDLKWQILRDGVAYHASVTYLNPSYDGTYEDGLYVAVKSITVGAPTNNGCTDGTYMEYDPLATEDDGSCSTFISVGCNDSQFVNYAGADVDADAIHDNAENFGDAFGQNYTVDLNNGQTSASGAPATIHDVDLCQTQVPGCTYPYAGNYDDAATEDDGSCDWSTYALKSVDPVTGEVISVDYSFGADDDDSTGDWNGSDFEYANKLYQDGNMGTGHVVTDLIASYDAFTSQYKADSTNFAINDSTWSADYDTLNAVWQRTYDDTLADVALWFAADELADSIQLADTTEYLWNLYNDTLADVAVWFAADELADSIQLADTTVYLWDLYNDTLADVAVWFAADEAADAQELADTIEAMQARYDANHAAHLALEARITDSLNYHRAPIEIDLHTGWNTVGYYLQHSSSVIGQFEAQFGSELDVANNINIVKNNEGLFYWPDFAFDGLVTLEPGQGYQVRVKDTSNGKGDFVFLHEIDRDDYRVLTPTVPVWALEMEVENHPNDIRTLVRVVNMLGQEVNPAEQFNGEVLLYLYNDGTVEKKMVK